MLALVTGATGCVGANVVEALLSRGYTVRAMRRQSSRLKALDGLYPEIVEGDVLDIVSLTRAMADCDLVFHVAAVSEYWRASPEQLYRVNVNGTRNVLQAAMQCHVQRVVHTSSVAVFGIPAYGGEILNESHDFRQTVVPFHYGHSKVLAEAEVHLSISEGLDVVIVNPSTVIGMRDINYIGGELIKRAKKGWFVAAPPGGMGVISAKDVGLGHVLAAENGKTGERYILNGENISHRKLLGLVASALAISPPFFQIPTRILRTVARVMYMLHQLGISFAVIDPVQVYLSTYKMYFDSTKAIEQIGFTPSTALEAVNEAISWYKQQGLL